MKRPMKKLVLVLALLLCIPGMSVALTISMYNWGTQQTQINNWVAGLGGDKTVVEDFEAIGAGWYQSLATGVGTFSVTGSTLAGSGTSSYGNKTGNGGAYFEVRDYNANGRSNTTSGGSNYLDSADISQYQLTLLPGTFHNLFFMMTDPSDVGAVTSVASAAEAASIDPRQLNGSRWFVGIDAGTDFISQILLSTSGQQMTNDGFGVDDFTTVAAPVPEPATLTFLLAGLTGLGLVRRRRK